MTDLNKLSYVLSTTHHFYSDDDMIRIEKAGNRYIDNEARKQLENITHLNLTTILHEQKRYNKNDYEERLEEIKVATSILRGFLHPHEYSSKKQRFRPVDFNSKYAWIDADVKKYLFANRESQVSQKEFNVLLTKIYHYLNQHEKDIASGKISFVHGHEQSGYKIFIENLRNFYISLPPRSPQERNRKFLIAVFEVEKISDFLFKCGIDTKNIETTIKRMKKQGT